MEPALLKRACIAFCTLALAASLAACGGGGGTAATHGENGADRIAAQVTKIPISIEYDFTKAPNYSTYVPQDVNLSQALVRVGFGRRIGNGYAGSQLDAITNLGKSQGWHCTAGTQNCDVVVGNVDATNAAIVNDVVNDGIKFVQFQCVARPNEIGKLLVMKDRYGHTMPLTFDAANWAHSDAGDETAAHTWTFNKTYKCSFALGRNGSVDPKNLPQP